ncbi:YcaO-like family protein [Tundrisphaera sp. TA3]|uniref:YcaO-like family protein n=1 Tax=Tundrisphaera sp. TA3 TaxID=3435775 RepID=UPI003EBFB04D
MADLTRVADAYLRNLPEGRRWTFAYGGLDRLGVPVVAAGYAFPDDYIFDGFGYGATPEEAMVGALGELSEDVHAEDALSRARRVEGSHRELSARLGPDGVCDPRTLCLPAGSPYSPDMPLTWVEARRLSDASSVLVPIEFAAISRRQLGGIRTLITPITNGQGAGLSRDQALAHGLLELLQRDGNGLSFRALDQGVVLNLDAVADPSALALLDRYREAGLRVIPKLASTEFGLANLYVVGCDDDPDGDLPIKLTACGEAAHPDRDRALRKALLEFGAARARKAFMHGPLDAVAAASPPGYLDGYLATLSTDGEEPRALAAMVDWIGSTGERLRAILADSVLSERSSVRFSKLPSVGDRCDTPEQRLATVAGRLAEAGLDVLYVDHSPPGGEVFACKAIVPGLEVETMSYRRIGGRGVRKLLERGSPMVGLGTPPPGCLPVILDEAGTERLGGPAWLDPRAVDAAVGPLYPLYREPSSHAAQVVRAGRSAAIA